MIAMTNNKGGAAKAVNNPSLKINTERYLIVKIDGEDGHIKTALSQNAIPFEEISIYSVEESWSRFFSNIPNPYANIPYMQIVLS